MAQRAKPAAASWCGGHPRNVGDEQADHQGLSLDPPTKYSRLGERDLIWSSLWGLEEAAAGTTLLRPTMRVLLGGTAAMIVTASIGRIANVSGL